MMYFALILVLGSGFLSQTGLSEIISSQKQMNLVPEDGLLPALAGCTCMNGNCVVENGKEVCKCPPGFGNYTRISCKACDCGPDSNCTWVNSGWFSRNKVCICKPGFYDKDGKCVDGTKSKNISEKIRCNCKNGNCVAENGKEVCKCSPGFGNYTRMICKACECGPDSNCTWIKSGWFSSKKVCICKPGFYDENGKCLDQNKSKNISEKINPIKKASCICKNGNCVVENGKEVCRCPPGFGNYTRISCKACDCGADSNCTWVNSGWFSRKKVCICKPGSYDKDGKCVDEIRKSQNINTDHFSIEKIDPFQRAQVRCIEKDCLGGKCDVLDGKEVCTCPIGFELRGGACREI